ncbi:MAG: sodium:solute symporter [Acidiferrobacterales bacterium]
MNNIDIAVLLIYIAGVTAFGAWFYRRSSTSEGFTSANRRLPGWAIGLSIFGTYLSSISFLALPGKAYVSNWNAFVFSLSLPVAAWVAVKWFAPLYRSTRDISAYAYLERRFGIWARLYAMTFYLLTQLARMGTIMFLVALALERLTGWDIESVIIVSGVLITFYTVVGGIEAVIWTDVVQSIVLTAGAILSVVLLVNGMPGGYEQLFELAAQGDKFSLGSFQMVFTEPTFWVVLLYGIVINLQNFGIDQSYIQRYQSARSLADARQSIWIGALTYVPVSALFLFIGTGLFAWYSARPELLPQALAASGMGDRVFPYFIVNELPAGITGIMIAALAAAAMSSIDTSINSSATILLTDVYRRLFRPDASEKQKMRFLRIATVILGISGTAVALLMVSSKGVLDDWWRYAGIFSGGMLGLFLLGLLSRRAASGQAIVGMIAGLTVIIWATLSRNLEGPLANSLHAFMTTVLGTLTIFIIGVLLSRRQSRKHRADPPLTVYDLK